MDGYVLGILCTDTPPLEEQTFMNEKHGEMKGNNETTVGQYSNSPL